MYKQKYISPLNLSHKIRKNKLFNFFSTAELIRNTAITQNKLKTQNKLSIIDHFRVALNFIMKARLNAKFLL